jgi:site-specific DNA recombinase
MSIKVRYRPEVTKPKTAVLYLRVSTEEQVDNFSLGTQEEICRKEAARRGYQVIEIFREEGKSAKTVIGRPALLEMLEYCKKNKRQLGAIIVYRLDRLSRQTQDFLTIRTKLFSYQITLISASEPTGDSPTEKLLETIMAGFAQHDNEVRAERTKNGMRARFLAGLPTGQVPLGYMNEHSYAVKDPQMFDKVRAGWDLMLTGTKSLREVAHILNDWGVGRSYRGKKHTFRPQTANMLFRNKFYMGVITSSRYPEEVKGQHTPMVTQAEFYRVQAILDGRNTSLTIPEMRRTVDNTDFPLRRIMKCSYCGTVFTGAWTKGRKGKYAYYFCRNRCGQPSLPVGDVESELTSTLTTISPTPEGLKMLIFFVRKNYLKRIKLMQDRQTTAETELIKLRELRQSLVEKNLLGVYSDTMFMEQNAVIEGKIQDLMASTDNSVLAKYTLEETVKFMSDKLADLGQSYTKALLPEKKALLGSIFPSGMAWNYPGISNQDICPIYQSILAFTNPGVETVQILARF